MLRSQNPVLFPKTQSQNPVLYPEGTAPKRIQRCFTETGFDLRDCWRSSGGTRLKCGYLLRTGTKENPTVPG